MEAHKDNVFTYLKWRGDLDFDAAGFNDIDAFICSQLSTPDYTGMISEDRSEAMITDVSAAYFKKNSDSVKKLGVLQSDSVLPMLKMLPEVRRFRETAFSYYINRFDHENAEQFCAVTLRLPDGSYCISFRGTDDTIIGWKEDFLLAVKERVQAQQDAVNYLNMVIRRIIFENSRCMIYVCGHSKGGNLAVYASIYADPDVRSRISGVWNFDGPGLKKQVVLGSAYESMRSRIRSVMSKYAFVGTLFETPGTVVIVNGFVHGPVAHDGFTWETEINGFANAPEGLTPVSRRFEQAMQETLDNMSYSEQEAFIEEFFAALSATGAVTLTDLITQKPKESLEVIKGLAGNRDIGRFGRIFAEAMLMPPQMFAAGSAAMTDKRNFN